MVGTTVCSNEGKFPESRYEGGEIKILTVSTPELGTISNQMPDVARSKVCSTSVVMVFK
jgi:hypothetical protein